MAQTSDSRHWLSAAGVRQPTSRRVLGFFASLLTLMLILYPIVTGWVRVAWTYDHYSHVLLIPAISAWLLYRNRDEWLRTATAGLRSAIVAAILGVALLLAAWGVRAAVSPNEFLSLAVTGLVTLTVACFLGFFGPASARAATFPLAFLFLAVPIPMFILDWVIVALQHASTEATYVLFKLTGIPVLREGFMFRLPGVTIEVAKECSGIRSSTALFILAILSSHLLLRTNSRRAILVALSLPLLIAKNAIRIAVLTLLAVHVDAGFLSGSLHRDGGVVFFMFTALIFGLILRLLRRSERSLAPVRALPAQAAHSSVN